MDQATLVFASFVSVVFAFFLGVVFVFCPIRFAFYFSFHAYPAYSAACGRRSKKESALC